MDDAKHLAALAEEADQHNPEIPPLVSQIEAAIDLHARKQRIAAAIEEIDILRTAEQFDAALKLLEDTVAREGTAQELDQTQALVRSDREAWTKRKAEEEHTLRLSELAHELQQPDLSVLRLKTVCEELSRLSAAWPADRRDRTLLREAEERLKARQRQDDIDNVIEQVEINRASGDLETGWQILEAALARLGETPQLIPLHQSLRSELDAKRRKERLESIVSDSTRALSTGNWREALPALEVAEREFPEESIIAGLVDSARAMKAAAEKQAAIDQALEGARKLASEHCWTEALQVIEGCWAQYPDEPVLAQERASLEAGFSAEHERVLGLIAAIDNALRDREHTAAVLVARSGRSELPHRMELLEAEARAWRALRAREVRQAVEDATALIRAGNLSAADNYLQRAHEIFPGETTLQIVTAELNQRQAARTSANFEASRSDSETGLTAHSLANPDKTSSDSSSANSKER
ncbi:MAG: hypothetical protein H7039_09345 [Bryobacteraceae bacterium]|nr:hypothetical protein [Bryobacteraceae bacterium]